MTAYQDEKGKVYHLSSKPVASGGEGDLYAVSSRPELIAKIYRNPANVHADKLRQLRDISRHIASPHLAWPKDILLADGRPVGFTMRKIQGTRTLADCLPDALLTFPMRIIAAINLCDVVQEVHSLGQCIGDMNPLNFGMDPVHLFLYMFDVDSLHFHAPDGTWHPCTVGVAEYFPPEMQKLIAKGRDLRDINPALTFSRNSDLFALAVLIFQLLHNGYHPFACRLVQGAPSGTEFHRQARNIQDGFSPWFTSRPYFDLPLGAPPLSILPDHINALFRAAFFSNRRPDAVQWQTALNAFLLQYRKSPGSWGPHEAAGKSYRPPAPSPVPKPNPKPGPSPSPTPGPVPGPTPGPAPAPAASAQRHWQAQEWCYLIALALLPVFQDRLDGFLAYDLAVIVCLIVRAFVPKDRRTFSPLLLTGCLLYGIGIIAGLAEESIPLDGGYAGIFMLVTIIQFLVALYDRSQYRKQHPAPPASP